MKELRQCALPLASCLCLCLFGLSNLVSKGALDGSSLSSSAMRPAPSLLVKSRARERLSERHKTRVTWIQAQNLTAQLTPVFVGNEACPQPLTSASLILRSPVW